MKWPLIPIRRKPEPGDIATLVERGVESPVVWEGHFTRGAEDELRFDVDRDFPFVVGDNILVSSGPLGNREAAFARLKGLHGNAATLATLSPWLPVNRRQQERFQTQLPACIAARDGDHAARLLDLSLGGLAIAMPRPAAVAVVAVTIGDPADAPALPIRVVSIENREDSIVLHAQFGTLNVQGHDYVSRLVGELSANLERTLARAA